MAAPLCSEPESTVPAAVLRTSPAVTLPVSVIIPVRNEGRNLRRCLESLRGAGEVYVIDSQSTDDSAEVARSCGSHVIQFYYRGGWPKKRQWALDMLPLQYEWVLLLDADEALTPALADEIKAAIRNPTVDGYYIGLDMFFLGRRLRHCGASFYKLSLFRHGRGGFECRAQHQDGSMCDMEVHEHVMVSGPTQKLNERLVHRNVESLSRYIQKHNDYSNWEAQVWRESGKRRPELQARWFGTQAERRRWIRKRFFGFPGSSLLFMVYKYVLCLGFLDGVPGLIYCGLQGVQFFQIKAKVYEAKIAARGILPLQSCQISIMKDSNVRH
ncbi:MAG TPA: glycosyltransferase family 2 protein [Terriglobales bacterium]|nr:glycosyltransferase family 2 protein [Terriglobales bacterium]